MRVQEISNARVGASLCRDLAYGGMASEDELPQLPGSFSYSRHDTRVLCWQCSA